MLNTRSAVIEAIHVISLAVWLSMLVTAALGASMIFPAMREAHATVPGYPAYPGEAWRLVGGLAASRIFFLTASIQAWCGLVAAFSFIAVAAVGGLKLRSITGAVRLIALLAGCATLTYYTHFYMPDMHAQLDTLLATSADPAQAEAAKAAQATFDVSHRTGTPLITTMALLVLAALALVPVSHIRRSVLES
jgi:hypothetical protein